MILLYTSLQLLLVGWLYLVWLSDTGGRIVFTPLTVFLSLDVIFSWNYWLLFQDIEPAMPFSALIVSQAASWFLGFGYLCWSAVDRIICRSETLSKRLGTFSDSTVRMRSGSRIYRMAVVFLLFIGLLFSALYYRNPPPVAEAIAQLAGGSELSEAQSIVSSGRRQLTKSYIFGGEYRGQGILKNLLFVTWTYGLTLSLVMAYGNRSPFWKISIFVFLCAVFLFIGGTGERSRLMWSLLVALIGISFYRRLDIRKLMAICTVITVCLILLSLLVPRYNHGRSKTELAVNLMASLGQRIFSGDKINNVRIMAMKDDGRLAPGYGRQHMDIALNVLPGIHRPPLANRLAERFMGKTTTYASGTYLGTVYLDFGVMGVVLVYFLLGACLHFVTRLLLELSKTPENLALIGLVTYAAGNMGARAGVISLISNLIPILVFHAMMMLFLSVAKVLGRRKGTTEGQPLSVTVGTTL